MDQLFLVDLTKSGMRVMPTCAPPPRGTNHAQYSPAMTHFTNSHLRTACAVLRTTHKPTAAETHIIMLSHIPPPGSGVSSLSEGLGSALSDDKNIGNAILKYNARGKPMKTRPAFFYAPN